MSFFEPENVRSIVGGRWLQRPGEARARMIDGVGIDSREDLSRKIFFAIKGENHDGHDHVTGAINAGAQLILIERAIDQGAVAPGVGVIIVKSTRAALGKLAHAYRRTLRGTKVIAVTGSAGKTTTKRLIHAVLSTQMTGSCSPKSFNNDIGVPLTLLQAQPSDKYVIVEVGTNHPGEIAALSEVAEPDIAVITSIGRSHLEGLGSVEAVAQEKASMLIDLKSGGAAILTADAPLLRKHFKLAKTRILFGESDDADLRLTSRQIEAGGQSFEVNSRQRFTLKLPGKHNAINALAAVAVGRRLGLDDQSIAVGLRAVEPDAMRLTPQHIGRFLVMNDAYNANPDSTLAALDAFIEVCAGAKRRVIILGDMLELGPAGPELHREVAMRVLEIDQRAGGARIDLAIFIGRLSIHAAQVLEESWKDERVKKFANAAAASASISKLIRPGDAILLKASRGIGLERIADAIHQTSKIQTSKRSKKPVLR